MEERNSEDKLTVKLKDAKIRETRPDPLIEILPRDYAGALEIFYLILKPEFKNIPRVYVI